MPNPPIQSSARATRADRVLHIMAIGAGLCTVYATGKGSFSANGAVLAGALLAIALILASLTALRRGHSVWTPAFLWQTIRPVVTLQPSAMFVSGSGGSWPVAR